MTSYYEEQMLLKMDVLNNHLNNINANLLDISDTLRKLADKEEECGEEPMLPPVDPETGIISSPNGHVNFYGINTKSFQEWHENWVKKSQEMLENFKRIGRSTFEKENIQN